MKFSADLPGGQAREPRRFIDWADAKSQLMANEGQWGLIATDVSVTVPQQLKGGRNKLFRGEELENFEFCVRRPEGAAYAPRRSDLWGRYTAPKKRKGKSNA